MKFVIKNLDKVLNVTGIANVHFFEFPSDYYTEVDSHPFYELVYVSNGSLHIDSDKYTGQLKKHQMILHYPNENHSLTCNEPPTVIIIGFTLDGSLSGELSVKPIQLTNEQIKNLAEIVKEGRNVFSPPYDIPIADMKKKKNSPFGSEQMLKNLLEYFLIDISRKNENKILTKKNENKLSIEEIIRYLEENFKEKISIDELSFLFNTNRTTICREFKLKTGTTVNDFINNKKIETAKLMIKNGDLTFTQISDELNFNSVHYFSRYFFDKTGMTASEYKKSVLKQV